MTVMLWIPRMKAPPVTFRNDDAGDSSSAAPRAGSR